MNEALIKSIKETPVKYARALGFDLLTDVHNDWLRTMLLCPDDYTLLGHRGSYKTTCLSVALAFGAVLKPHKSTFFIRKTDDGLVSGDHDNCHGLADSSSDSQNDPGHDT